MNHLKNEISGLTASEKFELLDALWASLEKSIPALSDAQRAELDVRVADYERNPDAVLPWEQVKADLFHKE